MSKGFAWAFWTGFGVLNLAVIAFYALYTIADGWAATRSELHGFDPSQLLPNDALLWLAATGSIIVLIVFDVLIAFAAVRFVRASKARPQARAVR